jgi:predicted amidophosphoribosyltransferase
MMEWGWSLLFPKHCVGCSTWLADETEWMIACEPCALDWPELHGKFGSMVMKERCRMAYAATGFRLRTQAELNAQLGAMKYGGNRWLARQWGMWLGQKVPPPAHGDCQLVLVPVPLHWRKQWKRGYNQAEWIARGIARVWRCEVASKLLSRRHHHDSMTGMNRSDRAGVTRNLYTVTSSTWSSPAIFVVVDDVMTTGATLAACGSALKQSGLNWCGGITLALA